MRENEKHAQHYIISKKKEKEDEQNVVKTCVYVLAGKVLMYVLAREVLMEKRGAKKMKEAREWNLIMWERHACSESIQYAV